MFRAHPAIVAAAAALLAILLQPTGALASEPPSRAMPSQSGRSPDPNDPWQGGNGAVLVQIDYVLVTGALPAANVIEVRMTLLDPATHCPVPRKQFKSNLSKQSNSLIATAMLAVFLEAKTAKQSVLIFPTIPASGIDGPAPDGIPGLVIGAVRTGGLLPPVGCT